MGKINVLSKNVAELIAAGEVIERPASIVKELLENSVDADATAITVEIKNGGITYLRITDNGCGIESEDVATAFLRHATSKLKEQRDLDKIVTLGFRGEALASICAVAKVEMITKTKQEQFGTKALFEGAEQKQLESTGAPLGTTIIIRDLFYNVPARLKFLKKDVSEANAIAAILDKIALSHPEISFKLINDNKVKLYTSGNGEMIDAIYSVFGKEFASSLIKAEYEYNGIKVNGYISKTSQTRNNRALQSFFVNSRYVKSKTCMAAIEEGYKNCILTGKFPCCVLNINVPFNEVDVNVHPAKIEVRFVNERGVFDAVYFAVKAAITANDTLNMASLPRQQTSYIASTFKNEQSVQTQLQSEKQDNEEKQFFMSDSSTSFSDITPKLETEREKLPLELNIKDNLEEFKFINATNTAPMKNQTPVIHLEQEKENACGGEKTVIEHSDAKLKEINDEESVTKVKDETSFDVGKENIIVKPIGELFNTYFLFEVNDNLVMIDKHAAHERILFEKLKKSIDTCDRQVLMSPVVVTLSKLEFDALMQNKEQLETMGFALSEFGKGTILLREAPSVLAELSLKEMIIDIATKLCQNKRDISSDIYEDLLHSMACKTAIRGNDRTSTAELIELVKLIYQNDEVRYCPHGRPIVISTSKYEIEKRFKRA